VRLLERLRELEIPSEPAFEREEYELRLARVRERMKPAGIRALVLTSAPNLLYLTGYETIMPAC